MRVLLVSTYELGHQPVHVASPAAALRAAGHDVRCADLAVESVDAHDWWWPDAVAYSVPMHTAMRLAVAAGAALRALRPALPIAFYGLYAAVSRDAMVGSVADAVFAGEYEPGLLAWVASPEDDFAERYLGRSEFHVPARDLLPPLEAYARLSVGGELRLAGAVEASHGCSHRCRHCPVPAVYDGRIRIIGEDVVLADIAQLVAAGARHITFADPDFLNGPNHSRRVVRALHASFPELTFDCTVKVEHILARSDVWPELASAGCLFVVSAFESVDEVQLARLDKGHTAADASAAVKLLRRHGIEIRPSWLPFTPWTTARSVAEMFEFVVAHDLVPNVDPVQYSIRLLIPEGSLLRDHPDLRPHLGTYDPVALGWTWTPAHAETDALQRAVAATVERRLADPTAEVFEELRVMTGAASAPTVVSRGPSGDRPRLTESWFCCSEPTCSQQALVAAQVSTQVAATNSTIA